MHLVEEHSVVDPTYIEDFLLTYRTFLSSPMVVGKKLLEWFHDPSLRDKVQAGGILVYMQFIIQLLIGDITSKLKKNKATVYTQLNRLPKWCYLHENIGCHI